MRGRPLLVAGFLSFTLSAALAQSRPGPAYFLRHPAGVPAWVPASTSLPYLGSPALAQPAPAAMPTRRAAAAYPALPAPASSPALADATPAPPRHYLTSSLPAPPYDLYQNWPEAQRKVTLPAPRTEPLPLQLLRSALGH